MGRISQYQTYYFHLWKTTLDLLSENTNFNFASVKYQILMMKRFIEGAGNENTLLNALLWATSFYFLVR